MLFIHFIVFEKHKLDAKINIPLIQLFLISTHTQINIKIRHVLIRHM